MHLTNYSLNKNSEDYKRHEAIDQDSPSTSESEDNQSGEEQK